VTIIDDKRRTGRTTRMVEAIYNWLVANERNHAVVFVLDAHRAFDSAFMRRCIEIGHPTPLTVAGRMKTLSMHDFHFEYIRWQTPLGLRRGVTGVPVHFNATSSTCRVFIDHAAIERMHRALLEEWSRYDAPDSRNVVQEDEEEGDDAIVDEFGEEDLPALTESFRRGEIEPGEVLIVGNLRVMFDEEGLLVMAPPVPRTPIARARPKQPVAVKPKSTPIVKPGERRLILRRPAAPDNPSDKD
jgi:hypothetical protein